MTQRSNENKESKSSKELEQDIGQTRSAISGDIKELSDKLSPSQLKHEAKQAVIEAKDAAVDKAIKLKDNVVEEAVELKDSAVEKAKELKETALVKAEETKEMVSEAYDEVSYQARRAGRATWSFTKGNAVPLVLIGVGAGWLISNSRRNTNGNAYDDDYGYDYNYDYDEASPIVARSDYPQGYPRAPRPAARPQALRAERNPRRTQPRERMEGKLDAASASAHELYDQTRGGLRRVGNDLAHSAERGAEYAQQQLRRARDASRDLAEANPIALGAVTLIAGIGIGMLLPSTRLETRMLEPARNKLGRVIDDARSAASEVADAAKKTARDGMHAIS